MCSDVNLVLDRYSARVYMMHDADALYIAAQVTDETPLMNDFDPNFEPLICHRGDTFYLRTRSGTRVRNFFTYYFSAKNQPAMVVAEGVDWSKQQKYSDGLKQGAQAAFAKAADGKGYVMEMRLPWSMVAEERAELQARRQRDIIARLLLERQAAPQPF